MRDFVHMGSPLQEPLTPEERQKEKEYQERTKQRDKQELKEYNEDLYNTYKNIEEIGNYDYEKDDWDELWDEKKV